ncbi:ferredoxin [Bacillota bacterium LX-D]|nr:ferredoxin [Bacillota bacterium LX-D]
MKVTVDQDLCIACGACIDIAPEIFEWNDDGLSHSIVNEVPEDKEEGAKESIEACPTEAIKEV